MRPAFDPWRFASTAADVLAATHASAQAMAAHRESRLAELLGVAARDSAFYRRVLKGRDPRGVSPQTLPVVRKAESMTRFDAESPTPNCG